MGLMHRTPRAIVSLAILGSLTLLAATPTTHANVPIQSRARGHGAFHAPSRGSADSSISPTRTPGPTASLTPTFTPTPTARPQPSFTAQWNGAGTYVYYILAQGTGFSPNGRVDLSVQGVSYGYTWTSSTGAFSDNLTVSSRICQTTPSGLVTVKAYDEGKGLTWWATLDCSTGIPT